MEYRLSKSVINSFCGDVLPIWLEGGSDISADNVEWSVSEKNVQLTPLTGGGALLTLKDAGTAYVFVKYGKNEYKCKVISREMRRLDPSCEPSYFRGNFHDHTSQDHDPKTFPERKIGLPSDYVNKIKAENLLDCSAVTDHAVLLTEKCFLDTFKAVENALPMDTVIFAGNESDISVRKKDRFGVIHKNGGEAVVINADGFISCDSWEEFEKAYESSPFAVGIFAHPQEMGGGSDGLWDFDFKNIYTPFLAKLMKGIEVGNGRDLGPNAVNEYAFSCALDAGFRVSTVSSCDHHGPNNQGYKAFPGKTVIMAYERSKEAFLDALNDLRFYASESANIKLKAKVNGKAIPCTVEHDGKYAFDVEISYFEDGAIDTFPVRCDVISNGGSTVKTVDIREKSAFSFEICSDVAEYFYLRLTDEKGRRTWSPPVFTDRRCENKAEAPLIPLDKTEFSVKELLTDTDADVLVNGNVYETWSGPINSAELVIDMKKEYGVSAIGVYSPRCISAEVKASGVSLADIIARFVCGYAISVSTDGKNYTETARGNLRIFGNEEIISFPKTSARYVRFSVLSTVGKARGLEKYADLTPHIAELSVFC